MEFKKYDNNLRNYLNPSSITKQNKNSNNFPDNFANKHNNPNLLQNDNRSNNYKNNLNDSRDENTIGGKLPILSKKFFIIDNNFACFKNYVIGSGSFGKVLYGMSVDRTQEYAIKFEKSTIKNSVILEELKIYNDLKGGDGIPNIFWEGEYKHYKVFIMDLLGPSLDKFYKIHNKLNLESTIFFGEQMVRRLEYMHSKNYIHRDIKPNNFLLGKYNRKFNDNKVYIIDFGLSKEYVDKKTKKHYEYNENSKFVGTPRYASVNTHMGIRQSRRDDLESVAYILIYFINGELPWQGIKAKTKSEKKEKIKISKSTFDVYKQCENIKEIPQQLIDFLNYTKELKFTQKPNYDYIVQLLQSVQKTHFPKEKIFDENYIMFEWNQDFLQCRYNKNTNSNCCKNRNMMGLHEDEKKGEEKEKDCEISDANYVQKERLFKKLYEGYPIQEFELFLDNLERIDNINKIFYSNQLQNQALQYRERLKKLQNNINNDSTTKALNFQSIDNINMDVNNESFAISDKSKDNFLNNKLNLLNCNNSVNMNNNNNPATIFNPLHNNFNNNYPTKSNSSEPNNHEQTNNNKNFFFKEYEEVEIDNIINQTIYNGKNNNNKPFHLSNEKFNKATGIPTNNNEIATSDVIFNNNNNYYKNISNNNNNRSNPNNYNINSNHLIYLAQKTHENQFSPNFKNEDNNIAQEYFENNNNNIKRNYKQNSNTTKLKNDNEINSNSGLEILKQINNYKRSNASNNKNKKNE